jgi:predicted Zn-dependent protease
MKLLLIFILLFIFSCTDDTLQEYYSPKVQPYMDKINKDMSYDFKVVVVVSDGVPHNSDEAIAHYQNGNIFVLESGWDSYSDGMREQVLYHELGHFLGLGHTAQKDNVMNSSVYFDDAIWEKDKTNFIRDIIAALNLRKRLEH